MLTQSLSTPVTGNKHSPVAYPVPAPDEFGAVTGHAGLIASVVSDRPQAPSAYKQRLDGIAGLSHVTVEVHACEDHARKAA